MSTKSFSSADTATATHPIARGWISTGNTGAQNYDEFTSDTEVTEAIAVRPSSVLAIEMPHRAPESIEAGEDFTASLPAAAARLAALQRNGQLTPVNNVVAPYRIITAEGVAYGVFCYADTSQISTSIDQPGRIIRNEDVFLEKVRQRVELTQQLDALLSAVLLVQTSNGEQLHEFLHNLIGQLGEPAVEDVDQHGQRHSVWLLESGPKQQQLMELAGTGELIVADGNHRTLAAQMAGLPQFLAVVTTPQSVHIRPYHRLLSELGAHTVESLITALSEAGAQITQVEGPLQVPSQDYTMALYGDGVIYLIAVPKSTDANVVDQLNHSIVEQLLFNNILGFDAGDKRITYVGGDYSSEWLARQVDENSQRLAVLIPPVDVNEFITVNLDRLKMPRKSTWFTPKVRAGLLVAGVEQ